MPGWRGPTFFGEFLRGRAYVGIRGTPALEKEEKLEKLNEA